MAPLITAERLTSLLRPRSVALVGASDKSAFSLLAYRNLVEFGFGAHTYLVSRRGAEVHGRPAVTSCAQIGEPVDVAYLMVPRAGISAALADAAAAGIRAMVNVGLSYLVTLGNEAMITAGHVLDYLVDDPGTRAVAVFMETVREPEAFRRAARRAAEADKAIVVLKAGSSTLSARTAAAHTGVLTGDDRVIDAVFADLGVIRVDSIEDMLITAGAAAALGRLARPGIGIVSISGGACDIVADRADDLGAELPELAPATRDALAAIMPAYGTVQNPPAEAAVRAAYQAVTEAAAAAGTGIDGVLVSPMRRGGTELLVGVVRDPQWGPVLAVAIRIEALDAAVTWRERS